MAVAVVEPPALPGAPFRHEVLQSLYVHRLLSTTQVHALHAPHASRRWVQVVLAGLEGEGYAARVTTATRAREALWFVTDQGAEACEGSGVPVRPYRMTPERAKGPLQAHTLAVNEVGLAFVAAARQRGDDFDAWGWRHESAHRLGDGKVEAVVIADAVLDYTSHTEGAVLCRFLELDRATMPLRELEAKLTAYARLYDHRPRSGGWPALYPQWPKVMVVFCGRPAPNLERRMRSLLELVGGNRALEAVHEPDSDFDIFVATLEDLRRTGPFSPVFRRPGAPEARVDVLGRAPRRPQEHHGPAGTGRGGRSSPRLGGQLRLGT